jgi:hypothetical protein
MTSARSNEKEIVYKTAITNYQLPSIVPKIKYKQAALAAGQPLLIIG